MATLFRLHAKSEKGETMLTIDRATLDTLEVTKHLLGRFRPTLVVNSTINTVRYTEYECRPSWIEFRNRGLTPELFVLDQIRPESIIDLRE